eukprot:2107929-Rhodomonas_salina.3
MLAHNASMQIGDRGVEELEELLRVNSTLQGLRLWGNQVTEAGICRLVEALENFPGSVPRTRGTTHGTERSVPCDQGKTS